MKFVVDNALSPYVAAGLRNNGFDAIHVREINLQTASDEIIFNKFNFKEHVIISADTDFSALLAHQQTSSPSLILFRQSTNRQPQKQVSLLLSAIPKLKNELEKGCIVVFDDKRVRIRYLPILGNE